MGGHRAVDDVLGDFVRQTGRAPGGSGAHGLLISIVCLCHRFAELVGLKPVFECATQLLFRHDEGGGPLVGPAVEFNRSIAEEIELLGDADLAAQKGDPSFWKEWRGGG